MEREKLPSESHLRAELSKLMQESEKLIARKHELCGRISWILDQLARLRIGSPPEDPEI
jgi:hypothetical protein